MKFTYVCTWSANVGDIYRVKLRFGYSGMRFQIRVSIQGSGTRISGYPLRSLNLFLWKIFVRFVNLIVKAVTSIFKTKIASEIPVPQSLGK